MKIVIVGPGAMGCLWAAFLAKAKQEIYLLDKRIERARAIQKQGILVEGISGRFLVKKIKATTDTSRIGKAEMIMITTKSYDTEEAVRKALCLLDEKTLVLTLQNGLGNVETLTKFVPPTQIIAGITAEGATLLADGRIRHAGRGQTIIGPISKIKNQKSKIKIGKIVDIFNAAGFETKIAKNIECLIWSKLIINVGINALTAITHLNNGRLLEFPGTKAIMKEAVDEAWRVARKKKISLNYRDPLKKVESVCRATAGNVSSMLQDILRKKRTEIEYINGAIVQEASKAGIPVPVNSLLTDLIKTIESSYALQLDKLRF